MSALLRLLAPLANVAALVFLTKRRKLTRALMQARADAADRAIPLEAAGLSAWWLNRLRTAGVIRQTPSGQYWLDSEAYGRYRRVRIVRAAIVLGLALGAWTVWTVTTCCGP